MYGQTSRMDLLSRFIIELCIAASAGERPELEDTLFCRVDSLYCALGFETTVLYGVPNAGRSKADLGEGTIIGARSNDVDIIGVITELEQTGDIDIDTELAQTGEVNIGTGASIGAVDITGKVDI